MNTDPPRDRQDLPDFDKFWQHSDPAETEKKFRDLLPTAAASGNVAYHAELLTQLARTEGLQGRFDEAHGTLDDAEALLTPELQRPRVRYLLERGRVFNSSGDKDQAAPLFEEAWELAQSVRVDGLAIDAAHMLAIVAMEDSDKAMEWNLQALEYAEASDQPSARMWLGALYNNIGWTYFEKDAFPKALEIFEKALAWREANKTGEQTVLIARWSVARVLRVLGRVEEALAMQETLEKAYSDSEIDSDGFVFEELAECKLVLGQSGHEELFARAYGLLKDTWVAQHEADRLARIKKLGKIDQE